MRSELVGKCSAKRSRIVLLRRDGGTTVREDDAEVITTLGLLMVR